MQRAVVFVGIQNAFDERTPFDEPLAIRVARVEPVRAQPRAHRRSSPHHAAIFEARDVVVVGKGAPNRREFVSAHRHGMEVLTIFHANARRPFGSGIGHDASLAATR